MQLILKKKIKTVLLSPSGRSLLGREHFALRTGLQWELVLLQAATCPAWPSPAHSRLFFSSSVPRLERTAQACRMLRACGEPLTCVQAGGLQSRADPWWVLAQFPVAALSHARLSSQQLDGASQTSWKLSAGHPVHAVGLLVQYSCAQLCCQSRDS